MGSKGSRQLGKAEQWVLRLAEATRLFVAQILVVTLRPWVLVGAASSEMDREVFPLVDHRMRRWRDWSRLRWR